MFENTRGSESSYDMFVGRHPPTAMAALAPPQKSTAPGAAGIEHAKMAASTTRTLQTSLFLGFLDFDVIGHLPLVPLEFGKFHAFSWRTVSDLGSEQHRALN